MVCQEINTGNVHNACSAFQNPGGQSRLNAGFRPGSLGLCLLSLENLKDGDSTASSENFCEAYLLQVVHVGAVGNETLVLF